MNDKVSSMGRIQKMDAQTANLIAAGEVVERPSGVVKELVENAIDAGSTRIEISLEGGGLDAVTVSDNGCGMDANDAEMCFERHATSKIHKSNDLWSIHTLGFRGEALPSIGSVAKVTLSTNNGEEGTRVIVAYGKKEMVSSYPCSEGTEIRVEGLFYHTPARLKHMRSGSYEGSLIQDLIGRFALSHPEIAFHLTNDGRDGLRTSGQGNLLEVIFSVYGRGPAEAAVQAEFSDYDYKVNGYIIRPDISRASRSAMNIFLNGRMVRTYKLFQAVRDAYEEYLPTGRYPMCVLSVEMDPHLLDVNVHPSKWEVRISKEVQLEDLLRTKIHALLGSFTTARRASVKEAVQTYYQPLSFDTEDLLPGREDERRTSGNKKSPAPVLADDLPKGHVLSAEDYEEPQSEEESDEPDQEAVRREQEEENRRMHEIYDRIEKKEEKKEAPAFPQLRLIGQYHDRMIIAESESGLVLIDQHRASERILIEQIRKNIQDGHAGMDLLVPVTVHADAGLVSRLDEINEACASLQIRFEAFGPDTLAVRTVPLWMQKIEEEAFLEDLIDSFRNDERKLKLDFREAVKDAAKHAVANVHHMSAEEMKQMIQDLSRCEDPYTDAAGKPVLIVMEEEALRKEFRK
jgi:DNA mismatch repair protein MutL